VSGSGLLSEGRLGNLERFPESRVVAATGLAEATQWALALSEEIGTMHTNDPGVPA
jgi:hypothetical protein